MPGRGVDGFGVGVGFGVGGGGGVVTPARKQILLADSKNYEDFCSSYF